MCCSSKAAFSRTGHAQNADFRSLVSPATPTGNGHKMVAKCGSFKDDKDEMPEHL
jgi:hypothetical protein